MRNNLRRVTIVMTKNGHARFREASRKYHGSLSQFVRMACENAIRNDGKSDALDFRSIVEKQGDIVNSIHEIEKRLQKVELGTGFLVDRFGSDLDKVACDIEGFLLNKNASLSIPELRGYMQYEQEEIISGMEQLEERFAVERIRQVNGPSKWKIQGDSSGL